MEYRIYAYFHGLTFALKYERIIERLESSHFPDGHCAIRGIVNKVIWHGYDCGTLGFGIQNGINTLVGVLESGEKQYL